jgi:hypothetical protein
MSRNEQLCGIVFLPIFMVPLRTLVLLAATQIDPNITAEQYSLIFFLVSSS